MRRTSRFFACLAAAIAQVFAACVPSPALAKHTLPQIEAMLDHFVCYFVDSDGFTPPKGVKLKDQWTDPPRGVTITSRQLLCNPASKDGKVMARSNSHLVCYWIDEATDVKKTVLITNQLDPKTPQRLSIGAEKYLCVPSGKQPFKSEKRPKLPAIPTNLDHFKCYDATTNKAVINKSYQVTDQFQPYQFKDFKPAVLCNPTEKFIDGESKGGMIHDDAHLMCYLFTQDWLTKEDEEEDKKKGKLVPPTTESKVLIANQFERKGAEFNVHGPTLFCFPSLKETVTEK
jgi:hypothetical protein